MTLSVRSFVRPLLLVGTVAALSACESTLQVSGNVLTWGFIQTSALTTTAGTFVTSPTGQFFRGALSSVPDARARSDSCAELTIIPTSPLNVTYLDAGPSIITQFGARIDTLPRITTAGGTTYGLTAPRPFTPGDSVIARIPGASGGFPPAEIRAKTAEAFTLDSLIIRPPAAVQLRWTPATDLNSAMVVEFRYSSSGGTTFNQLIRCSFVDDGADSIAFRVMQPWIGQSAGSRNATYTRLRTTFQPIVDGFLEVISTFAVPTPRAP